MKKEKLKKITENDEKEIGQKMLKAAIVALGDFSEQKECEHPAVFASLVVRAMSDVETVRKAELQRFHTDSFLDINTSDVVATAFWVWSEQVDIDICEIAPCSMVGGRYLGFAQGLFAAKAMTDAIDALEDENIFYFSERGAIQLTTNSQES